jgi:hypothetical protein
MLLGDRLLQLRLTRRAPLGEALQAQHIQGGRLGTNLVQLGHLDLDGLATALGAHHSVAVAVESQFEAVRAKVLARLPREVAEACLAVPVNETAAGTLVVAMMDPRDRDKLAAIEHAVGGRVQACVAPELRVRYWLEKHYSVPRPPRYLRADPGQPPSPDGERRRTIPALPAPAPGESRLGRITTVKRVLPDRPPADDLELDITVDARRRSPEATTALARLEEARGADAIAQVVVDYLAASVGCGLLLVVRGDVALTWRAAPPIDPAQAGRLAIGLDLPTAFRVACETGATFRGQPPEAGRAWHERLVQHLGQRPPLDLAIVPIRGPEHVLALIYVHMGPREPVPQQIVGDLEALAETVARLLGRVAKP